MRYRFQSGVIVVGILIGLMFKLAQCLYSMIGLFGLSTLFIIVLAAVYLVLFRR